MLVDDMVLVFFKWSKTNQSARKVSWIPITPVPDVRFDLRIYFKKLINSVKAPVSAPLYSFEEDKFHTRNSLVSLLNIFQDDISVPKLKL